MLLDVPSRAHSLAQPTSEILRRDVGERGVAEFVANCANLHWQHKVHSQVGGRLQYGRRTAIRIGIQSEFLFPRAQGRKKYCNTNGGCPFLKLF